jgi:spore germination protein GerM
MEIESHDSELELSTNETPREALADALSGNVPEYETIFLLPEGTEINHLFYDSEAGVVNVDFSEELITDLQAGSGTESLVLQSIVNTIGSYYGADEVLLTVEGQPYESGHMAMSEGETWPVDY